MKNRISLLIIALIGIVLISYRMAYTERGSDKHLNVTTWDAFGYYMYAPSVFIYGDVTELKWLPEVDSLYALTGGELYQSNKHTNGNYVNKYLGGISIMQMPFFLVAHMIAVSSNYKADGFSPPYQYAVAFAAIFYCLLGLIILRSVLRRYYSDRVTTITLLLLTLATNLIQYVAIDGGQSHAYIFPLYAFIIWLSIKWHESPQIRWALLIGATIGLATICRPTEAIMLFIPLLWNTQSKENRKEKWLLVKQHRMHIIWAVVGGIIAISPQLIYWKYTSGSFIYDVGSKWFFLTPFFRVLFGFENGWFIYTPITMLFIIGFFFIKGQPFRRSVIVFCLLNIWIIIAWSDWHYGATYSTRALVQSYPVFALGLAGFVNWLEDRKWKVLLYIGFLYLIFVNHFQIWQYNQTILHYRDMNAAYYKAIYLNPHPTPLDMSLMDTNESMGNEADYQSEVLVNSNQSKDILNNGEFPDIIASASFKNKKDDWIKVELTAIASYGFNASNWNCKLVDGKKIKEKSFRMAHAMSSPDKMNDYAFYVKVPEDFRNTDVYLFSVSWEHFEGIIEEVKITHYWR